MHAYQLHKPDGTPTHLFACGVCGQVSTDLPHMEAHCQCPDCGAASDPRKPRRSDFRCEGCERAYRARREADKLAKAQKLDDWDGVVWTGGHGGDFGDGYFSSLETYGYHLEAEFESPADWPEFVYVAEPVRFAGLDLDRILENACDDWSYDGFEPENDLNGVADLRKAIDAFNAANKDVVAYYADETKAVRVHRPAAD